MDRVMGSVYSTWQRVCEGTGLAQEAETPSGRDYFRIPQIVWISPGPPLAFVVRMLPGQIVKDYREVASRIAPAFNSIRFRVSPAYDRRHVLLEAIDHDPLQGFVEIPYTRNYSIHDPVLAGYSEDGSIDLLFAQLTHAVIQGVTGSGKSSWLYSLLVQLSGPKDVTICGSDPSGLLWRPFTGSWHAEHQVSGMKDLQAHVDLLGRLVAEMDRRVEQLPPGLDQVIIDDGTPMIILVMEEYPGLLRAIDQADSKGLGKQLRAHMARLLAEGRKAGIRVLLITQRAEATLIGAHERAMCSLRISFRTDNKDAVKLLHPADAAEEHEAHMTAAPGIALLTAPGLPLTRFRGPYIDGGYAAYCRLVTSRLAG